MIRKKIMLIKSTGLAQDSINQIINENPEAEYVIVDDNKESIYGAVRSVNAIIGCPRNIMTAELLELTGESLDWVHNMGAGIDTYLFKEFVESNIVLTNGKIIQGPEVADHAMSLLLALTRNLHFYINVSDPPNEKKHRPIELRKKTALVIGGGGGIGMLIAERASAFGMIVSSVEDDMMNMVSFIEKQYTADQLLEVLPKADVVFMAAPLTAKTQKVINKKAISLMKDDSFLVNVCRGETIDTEALIDALKAGKFRGVGLDVTNPEPLPKTHLLNSLHRVILTPHVAGPSDWNRVRSFELAKANIRRYISSNSMLNEVDKSRQY
jgi:phosphoglycerate dehydrogenase-like enzyme